MDVQSFLAALQLFLSLNGSIVPHQEPACTAQVGAGVVGLVDVGFGAVVEAEVVVGFGVPVVGLEVVGVAVDVPAVVDEELPNDLYQLASSSPRHSPTVTPVHFFALIRSK